VVLLEAGRPMHYREISQAIALEQRHSCGCVATRREADPDADDEDRPFVSRR
jgi:hypothetical protein